MQHFADVSIHVLYLQASWQSWPVPQVSFSAATLWRKRNFPYRAYWSSAPCAPLSRSRPRSCSSGPVPILVSLFDSRFIFYFCDSASRFSFYFAKQKNCWRSWYRPTLILDMLFRFSLSKCLHAISAKRQQSWLLCSFFLSDSVLHRFTSWRFLHSWHCCLKVNAGPSTLFPPPRQTQHIRCPNPSRHSLSSHWYCIGSILTPKVF